MEKIWEDNAEFSKEERNVKITVRMETSEHSDIKFHVH